jgi:glycerol-3-phosphate dehydrogenase
MPVLNQVDYQIPECKDLSDKCRRRLLGRFGSDTQPMVKSAHSGEMNTIPGSNYLWAELRWAARAEGVSHLDDLLLRRTRLGQILPKGAESILPKVKSICLEELGWSENRWKQEQFDYQTLWGECYYLPSHETIPDWKQKLVETKERQILILRNRRRNMLRRSSLAAILLILTAALSMFFWRRSRHSR